MELIGVFCEKTPDEYLTEIESRIRERYKDWGEIQVRRSLTATVKAYERYKGCEVTAECLEDFIHCYGKPKQFSERGEEYLHASLDSHRMELQEDGYTFITHHDSKSGEQVSYYGRATKDTVSGQKEKKEEIK